MRRLLATMRCDLVLQWRNGFFYAAAFVTGLWLLAGWLGGGARFAAQLRWLLPALLVNELVIVTFFFVGGLVLLEKGEGSLRAQLVAPLRTREYLLSKIATLTGAAVLQCLGIVAALGLAHLNWVLLTAGLTLLAIMFVLVGLIAVLRAPSLEAYLGPAVLYVAVLFAPLLPYVAGWAAWPFYLHPVAAPLALLHAAVSPAPWWYVGYGLVYSASAIWLLYRGTLREWRRFVLAAI